MKKGTKVRVVNNDHEVDHYFEIGEEVECTGEGMPDTGNYRFTNKSLTQWMHPSSYEPIKKPKTREQLEKKIAKYTKQLEGLESKKLELNKWYIGINQHPVFLVSKSKSNNMFYCYGFDLNGEWFDEYEEGRRSQTHVKNFKIPATEEEVFEALKAEAIKRGFKEGVKTKGVGDNLEVSTITEGMEYKPSDNVLKSNCVGKFYIKRNIFKNGSWAEIISTPTLNGKEVKVDDLTIQIGCNIFNREIFERTVDYLFNHSITSLTHTELGEIKINDLKELIK